MSKTTSFLAGIGVVLLLVIGATFGFFLPRWIKINSPPTIANTSAVLQQIQSLSQWVTVKYVLEKVVILEDAKWYGDNRVTLIAHGIVKAGINFQNLKPDDIKISDTSISLALPPAVITDVYIDDHHTQVLERATGVFRMFDKDLEQNARAQAVEELRNAARLNGIIRDAQDRAQGQLEQMLHQRGFKQVSFSIRPVDRTAAPK
jgi:hypothetical protein